MKLCLKDYRNKVLGCFTGKNIGGTLGAPFEGRRGVFDVEFYTQKLDGDPFPNDDLDLQLAWLNAAEKYGRRVDAAILGEYWNSYIMPNWSEYGAGKNNLRAGLVPPLSGVVNNLFRDSCGAFIRSELWACLTPGNPEIAVRYAYEDAIVDHSNEGVYGEIFTAAVQSAAFAEKDKWKLIDIGLSYIPEDCGIVKGIRTVTECYRAGESWREARKKVLTAVPGSFGMIFPTEVESIDEVPEGRPGYDAPSNVAIMVLGWLYGEDDFAKSICIATNCGEDADCTAATLGATLGIIVGYDRIPRNWIEPIGDGIKTVSLNVGDQITKFPATVTELTDRILKLTPSFLGGDICDCIHTDQGYSVAMQEQLTCGETRINPWVYKSFRDCWAFQPFCVKQDFVIFSTTLNYLEEPYISEGTERKLKLTVENNIYMQQWITVKWHLPEGWEISPCAEKSVPLEQYHANIGAVELEFTIVPHGLNRPRYDLVAEISSNGRHTKGFVSAVLFAK